MKEEKGFIFNKILIVLAVIIGIFALLIILFPNINKMKREIDIRSTNSMELSYASESETWDISGEDGSVIATLDADGLLTIYGTGKMKDFNHEYDIIPWEYEGAYVKNIIINEGVTNIGINAFRGCYELISIDIPSTVIYIGENAIDLGNTLQSINVNDNNTMYCDDNGVLYTKNKKDLIKYPGGKKDAKYSILDGTINIKEFAFYDSLNLKVIEMPDTVVNIENHGFEYCPNLINIKMSTNVTCIGDAAFAGCSALKSIKISDSVTEIGNDAFAACLNLAEINIPKNVVRLGFYVFGGCENLENINVDSHNIEYCDEKGVLYTKDKTKIIKYPEGRNDEQYKILDNVTVIEEWSFMGSNLVNIEMPNTVIFIGASAFYGAEKLEGIKLSSGLTNIDDYAFAYCTKLKDIELPDNLVYIGVSAFSNCNNLKNIKIPGSVEKIEENIFSMCKNLTTVQLSTGTISIGNNAFNDCQNLVNIEMPSTVTTIGENAFSSCRRLEKVEIPNGVTGIGNSAFSYCENLEKIELPDTVLKIGNNAFYGCRNLNNIELPENITNIGEEVFSYCKIINLIDSENTIAELPSILKRTQDENDILFSNDGLTMRNGDIYQGNIRLYEGSTYAEISVKAGKLKGLTYVVSHNSWNVTEGGWIDVLATANLDEQGILTISGTGKVIENGYGDMAWRPIVEKIRKVKIDDGITNIINNAFSNCINLESVEIPNSVTSIGNYAFANCSKLTNIKIPSGVTNIGNFAFYSCRSLENIEIPDTVSNIEEEVFSYCSNLKDINVDANNTNFCDINGVLYSKDKIELKVYPAGKEETEIFILNGVKTIDKKAFAFNSNLITIEIPDSVTSIGDNAFESCQSLKYIKFPKNVTSIGKNILQYCWQYIILCYPNTVVETYAQENGLKYQLICLNSTQYKIDEKDLTIDSINPNTTIEEIKQILQSEILYEVINQEGNILTGTDIIGTGYKIKISETQSYTVLVSGDSTGDGKADLRDILQINKNRLNKTNLDVEYLKAGDVNKDGKTDLKDILQINKFRLGKIQTL